MISNDRSYKNRYAPNSAETKSDKSLGFLSLFAECCPSLVPVASNGTVKLSVAVLNPQQQSAVQSKEPEPSIAVYSSKPPEKSNELTQGQQHLRNLQKLFGETTDQTAARRFSYNTNTVTVRSSTSKFASY